MARQKQEFSDQFISLLVSTVEPPIRVSSTVVCPGLNASYLQGLPAAAFARTTHGHYITQIIGLSDALAALAPLVGSSDIEITDFTKGLILRSPDGTRYRITVSDAPSIDVNPV